MNLNKKKFSFEFFFLLECFAQVNLLFQKAHMTEAGLLNGCCVEFDWIWLVNLLKPSTAPFLWAGLFRLLYITCGHSHQKALTATAALHADLWTLLGGNDPLRFPRACGSDGVQLVLQHRFGLRDSRVAPCQSRFRGRQEPPGRFNQTPNRFAERHVASLMSRCTTVEILGLRDCVT